MDFTVCKSASEDLFFSLLEEKTWQATLTGTLGR